MVMFIYEAQRKSFQLRDRDFKAFFVGNKRVNFEGKVYPGFIEGTHYHMAYDTMVKIRRGLIEKKVIMKSFREGNRPEYVLTIDWYTKIFNVKMSVDEIKVNDLSQNPEAPMITYESIKDTEDHIIRLLAIEPVFGPSYIELDKRILPQVFEEFLDTVNRLIEYANMHDYRKLNSFTVRIDYTKKRRTPIYIE
jgi:hypothetical protein